MEKLYPLRLRILSGLYGVVAIFLSLIVINRFVQRMAGDYSVMPARLDSYMVAPYDLVFFGFAILAGGLAWFFSTRGQLATSRVAFAWFCAVTAAYASQLVVMYILVSDVPVALYGEFPILTGFADIILLATPIYGYLFLFRVGPVTPEQSLSKYRRLLAAGLIVALLVGPAITFAALTLIFQGICGNGC